MENFELTEEQLTENEELFNSTDFLKEVFKITKLTK